MKQKMFFKTFGMQIKLPWVDSILGLDGKVYQIKCNVSSKIKVKEKLFTPKLDNRWKHDGKRKALIVIPNVCKTRKFYMNKDFVHAKDEHLYANVNKDTIANQVFHSVIT